MLTLAVISCNRFFLCDFLKRIYQDLNNRLTIFLHLSLLVLWLLVGAEVIMRNYFDNRREIRKLSLDML